MCRHLAWLGRPRAVSQLVLDPPCGLLRQSFAPRRQAHGRINADGWGVGLYPFQPLHGGEDGGRRPVRPVRWRSSRPLWQDASFASVAPALVSTAVIAAVRSATVGMPIDETATAPFLHDRWLLSHNGRVDRTVLPAVHGAESVCDSALLAAMVWSRGAEHMGDVVREVAARDPLARLNLLATDGQQVLATTWGDTLSYLVTDDGVAVCSEPWDDDPGWIDVPDRRLVHVSASGVVVTELSPVAPDPQEPAA